MGSQGGYGWSHAGPVPATTVSSGPYAVAARATQFSSGLGCTGVVLTELLNHLTVSRRVDLFESTPP